MNFKKVWCPWCPWCPKRINNGIHHRKVQKKSEGGPKGRPEPTGNTNSVIFNDKNFIFIMTGIGETTSSLISRRQRKREREREREREMYLEFEFKDES